MPRLCHSLAGHQGRQSLKAYEHWKGVDVLANSPVSPQVLQRVAKQVYDEPCAIGRQQFLELDVLTVAVTLSGAGQLHRQPRRLRALP